MKRPRNPMLTPVKNQIVLMATGHKRKHFLVLTTILNSAKVNYILY
jgi:hypothetical protein